MERNEEKDLAKPAKRPPKKPRASRKPTRSPSKRGARGRKGLPVARILTVLFALVMVAMLGAVTFIRWVQAGLPPVPTFVEYAEKTPKVSRIEASDGTVVAEFFTERRTVIKPDDIPKLLENALLAAEDGGFRTHTGVSVIGIARAMLSNLVSGHVTQGGSTITQQVVKQVLLSPERTYWRKFRELLLAKEVEARLTKDEILAIYMSEVYLGHGRYGFEEASRFYFGKKAHDLELNEAALLAGLVSAPSANNPLQNPDKTLKRQHYVLHRMAELKMITEAQARASAATTLQMWVKDEPRLGAAPYFVDAVRREARKLFGWGRLLNDGLTIRTTLDLDVSSAAETSVAIGLASLWEKGRTREEDEKHSRRGYRDGSDDLQDEIPPPPKSVKARIVECDRSKGRIVVSAGGVQGVLDPRSLARRILGGRPDPFEICGRRTAVPVSLGNAKWDGGGVTLPMVNAELGPQAAMVVLDPETRAVKAMVGGEDFETRPFNRAIQTRRPIGSTVKPFLYAAALESGMSASEKFTNDPVSYRGHAGRSWTPRNFGNFYDGREYTMVEAMAASINVVAVKVLSEIGPSAVAGLLERLGMDGHVPRDLSLALGSVEASPLVLANAMATFANGGKNDVPYMIESVRDYKGKVLIKHEGRPSPQLKVQTAWAIKKMLRQVITDGTARNLADLSSKVWGKTGTTNRSREAWFVGSEGRYMTAIMVGYDDRLPMHGATGGDTAAPLFRLFVKNSGTPDKRRNR